MLVRLLELQQRHLQLVADFEHLCAAYKPDQQAIGTIRFELARCGRARFQYISVDLLPQVERNCSPATRVELADFRRGIAVYQSWVSDHVNRWSTAAIIADWNGYRKPAAELHEKVRARIREEERLFRTLPETKDLV